MTMLSLRNYKIYKLEGDISEFSNDEIDIYEFLKNNFSNLKEHYDDIKSKGSVYYLNDKGKCVLGTYYGDYDRSKFFYPNIVIIRYTVWIDFCKNNGRKFDNLNFNLINEFLLLFFNSLNLNILTPKYKTIDKIVIPGERNNIMESLDYTK